MVRLMMIGGFSTSIGIAGFSTSVQVLQGKTTVKNRSGKSNCVKPEEGCDPFVVQAGKNGYDIDGVKSNGVVYKISDSCHAVVRKDGSVNIKSVTGKIVNKIIGGGVLTTPPEEDKECWQKLFDA